MRSEKAAGATAALHVSGDFRFAGPTSLRRTRVFPTRVHDRLVAASRPTRAPQLAWWRHTQGARQYRDVPRQSPTGKGEGGENRIAVSSGRQLTFILNIADLDSPQGESKHISCRPRLLIAASRTRNLFCSSFIKSSTTPLLVRYPCLLMNGCRFQEERREGIAERQVSPRGCLQAAIWGGQPTREPSTPCPHKTGVYGKNISSKS